MPRLQYAMLCGYAPFKVEGRTSLALYEAVKNELKFPVEEWGMCLAFHWLGEVLEMAVG